MVVRYLAKAGSAADDMFIGHPHRGGPHKGLVVEAGREKPRQQRIHRTHIRFQRGKAVLAFGIKPVIERNLRGPQIGFGKGPLANTDKCIRFLGAGGHDAAGTMIFE